MDHSRSPRRYHNAGGQVSYYPPLSDEARRALRGTAPEPMPTTRFLQIIETIRRDHTFYHDDYGASIPLEPLYTHILATMNLMTQAEAFAAPDATGARWVNPPTPLRPPHGAGAERTVVAAALRTAAADAAPLRRAGPPPGR